MIALRTEYNHHTLYELAKPYTDYQYNYRPTENHNSLNK